MAKAILRANSTDKEMVDIMTPLKAGGHSVWATIYRDFFYDIGDDDPDREIHELLKEGKTVEISLSVL